VNTTLLFFFLLVLVLANDDGGALAWYSGLDEEALMVLVEVHADTARVVDARRLAVSDRRR